MPHLIRTKMLAQKSAHIPKPYCGKGEGGGGGGGTSEKKFLGVQGSLVCLCVRRDVDAGLVHVVQMPLGHQPPVSEPKCYAWAPR